MMRSNRARIGRVGRIVGFVMALAIVTPIVLVLFNSLKTEREFLTSFISLESSWQFENYRAAAEEIEFLGTTWNSVVVAACTIVPLVILSSMAGYKLSRVRVFLSKLIIGFFLLLLLIPAQGLMIPIVITARNLGLIDSLLGLILFQIATMSAVTVFMYQSYYHSVPRELDESAYMDGASSVQIFARVIFPLVQPMTLAILVLFGLGSWNNFLFPLILITDSDLFTLPLALRRFFGEHETRWTEYFSAVTLSALPIMVFTVLVQRHFAAGITAGALKG